MEGEVAKVELPRPPKPGAADAEQIAAASGGGLGFIYVKFETVDAAAACRAQLGGRSFNGQVVVVHFYPTEKFDAAEFVDIGKPS